MSVYSVTAECRTCGAVLPPSAPKASRAREYCNARCRNKAWRTRWPEQARARGEAFRFANPGYGRRVTLSGYGLTADEYDALLAAQGGVCAVCGQGERRRHRNGVIYSLAVDHDHQTGRVRGLLCKDCNLGIGVLDDDPARLQAAARYLLGGD